jgi:hypothetical protein
MDLVLQYHAERKDDRWWLVRSGPPEVALPKRPDGTRPKLGIRDYALRRILTNVAERDAPQRSELVLRQLRPPLDSLEPLVVRELVLNNGWFCVAIEPERKVRSNSKAVAE